MTNSTRDYFDRMAVAWDKGGPPDEIRRRLESLVALFGIPDGGRVLDVGTGTGILHPCLLAAVGKSGRVLAFDFSSCMLEEAHKKLHVENLACFQADVTAIPLPDRSCDCVVCFAAFPHFDRKQLALQEMARVAKHGGRVVIAHLMSRRQIARHHNASPEVAGHCLPPAGKMRRLFSAVGLKAVRVDNEPGRYVAIAENTYSPKHINPVAD
jgi:ubiquinone/menaquinone biosynthesis C-methylase UbiE